MLCKLRFVHVPEWAVIGRAFRFVFRFECGAALNPFRFQPPCTTNEQRNWRFSCSIPQTLYGRHCLAHVRASSRGAWLAEQGGARVPVFTQTGTRVVSDHRPCPSRGGCCLQWLDVDGLKGGANAAWIGARSGSSVQLPEERSREEKRRQWSAGRCACRSPGARAPSQRCPVLTERLSALRSLTPVREGKMTALPAADPTTGAMTHVCSNVWVCTRLFDNRI